MNVLIIGLTVGFTSAYNVHQYQVYKIEVHTIITQYLYYNNVDKAFYGIYHALKQWKYGIVPADVKEYMVKNLKWPLTCCSCLTILKNWLKSLTYIWRSIYI